MFAWWHFNVQRSCTDSLHVIQEESATVSIPENKWAEYILGGFFGCQQTGCLLAANLVCHQAHTVTEWTLFISHSVQSSVSSFVQQSLFITTEMSLITRSWSHGVDAGRPHNDINLKSHPRVLDFVRELSSSSSCYLLKFRLSRNIFQETMRLSRQCLSQLPIN